jgi:hypothetical protein
LGTRPDRGEGHIRAAHEVAAAGHEEFEREVRIRGSFAERGTVVGANPATGERADGGWRGRRECGKRGGDGEGNGEERDLHRCAAFLGSAEAGPPSLA